MTHMRSAHDVDLRGYLQGPELPADTPVSALKGYLEDRWTKDKGIWTHSPINALTYFGQLGDLPVCRWLIATFRVSAQDAWHGYMSPLQYAAEHGDLSMCQMVINELNMTQENVKPCRALHLAAKHGHVHVCTWLVNTHIITKQDVLVDEDVRQFGFAKNDGGLIGGDLDTWVWLAHTFGLTRHDIDNDALFRRIRACETKPRKALWLICHYGVTFDEVMAHIHRYFLMLLSTHIEVNEPVLLQEIRDDNVQHCGKGSWVVRKLASGFGWSQVFWMTQTCVNA